MLVLSLAACGKQDTDDGVKKFYNSMNDTTEAVGESTQSGLKAAAEENGKSVKKSSDILIVSDINSANETIRVYNYSTGVQYQYYYGLTTGSSQSTNSSQGTGKKSSDSSGNSLTNKDISDYLSTLTSLLSSK